MVDKVNGKVIIITGGADGIGLSCAKKLLQHGAHGISIIDKDEEKGEHAVRTIIEEFGTTKAIFIQTDVTKLDEFDVINNAGICNDAKWELEIAVNCSSLVYGTLLGLKYMGKDKGGKGGVIINTSSNLGLQPLASCPIYVGTKHFVIGFSRSLGTPYHYDRTGIKILTICPGCTNTALVANASQFAFTALSPDMGELLVKEFSASPAQSVDNVAEGLITLVTNGENGSVWLAEGNEPVYEIIIPDRRTLRKS